MVVSVDDPQTLEGKADAKYTCSLSGHCCIQTRSKRGLTRVFVAAYGRWFVYLAIAIRTLEALPDLLNLKQQRKDSVTDFQLLKWAEIQVRLAVNLIYICFDNTTSPITGATRSGLDFAAVCADRPELTEEFQALFRACKTLRMNSFAKYDGRKGKTEWTPFSKDDLLKVQQGNLSSGDNSMPWEYSKIEYVGVGAKDGLRFARYTQP